MRFALLCTLPVALGLMFTVAAPAQTAATAPTTKKVVHHKHRRAASKAQTPAVITLDMEKAPARNGASPATKASEAQQRAADQQLLEQQRQQSAQAAQVNNQQVRTAEQQKQKVQSEQRIQDAPGPAQTGVVPAAGVPVVPASTGTDTRIQDAPGPAQTLAPQAPSTTPQQPPQF